MERARAAGSLACPRHGEDDEAPLIPVRVDGKTVRGARTADGSQVHLLAALAGQQGVVAAQAEAGAKTACDEDWCRILSVMAQGDLMCEGRTATDCAFPRGTTVQPAALRCRS